MQRFNLKRWNKEHRDLTRKFNYDSIFFSSLCNFVLKLLKNCFCHIGAHIDSTLWIGSKCWFNCTVGYEDDHTVFASEVRDSTLVVALLMLHQATSRDGDGMDDTEKIKEPNQSIRMEQKIQGFMPVEFCQRWSSPATGRWIQSSR